MKCLPGRQRVVADCLIQLSIYLSIYLYMYISTYLSIYLFIYLSFVECGAGSGSQSAPAHLSPL